MNQPKGPGSEDFNFEKEGEDVFPTRCPICGRLNEAVGRDFCSHYLGQVYDGSLTEGPYANAFQELWNSLYYAYNSMTDDQADSFAATLRASGLQDILDALYEGDSTWWQDKVSGGGYVEPKDHFMASEGWIVYHENPQWFESIIEQVRSALSVAKNIVA